MNGKVGVIKTEQRPEDQTVEFGDIRTRYWAVGERGAPVILLHGLGGFIENWDLNIADLAQERTVYALDLPGFGRGALTSRRLSTQFLTWPLSCMNLCRP